MQTTDARVATPAAGGSTAVTGHHTTDVRDERASQQQARQPRKAYHHGKTPAAIAGSVLAGIGFILGALGAVMGPNWTLIIAGVVCIVLGGIAGWALGIAGYGQTPRP